MVVQRINRGINQSRLIMFFMFIDKDKEKRSKRQISKQRRQTTNKTKVIAISKKRDMGQVMLIVEGFQTV